MAHSIIRVSDTKDRLGESPIWDAAAQALFWIDSLAGVLHRLDWRSGARRDFAVPAPVGSFALACVGDAILALRDGFGRYDFASGALEPLAALGLGHPDLRLNDGKVDRQGRFLAGTIHSNQQPGEVPLGGLYRLDPGGTVTLLVENLATTNGACFSPDGRMLY
jgi:sugar lactone lactonase YvrE